MMQDFDPHKSVVRVVDYLTDVSEAAKVLNLCLEQIAENPPDLLSRLHYLIHALHGHLECVGDDGAYHARRLRDYLDKLKLVADDQSDRPSEPPQ